MFFLNTFYHSTSRTTRTITSHEGLDQNVLIQS